jgi:hypothetical protein
MKIPDKSLEQRLYKLVQKELTIGIINSLKIIHNYELSGYDMEKIKQSLQNYSCFVVREFFENI